MKFWKSLAALFVISSVLSAQKVTGLSNWNIYLDPGHSQKENMGIYNYSEAEKNLRVAFYLREMLLTQTDIDTVWLCRYDDNINVGLTQRSTDANNLGAAWFHSIHSNAGGPAANDALLLYGQIRDYSGGPVKEKVPNGGKALSEIMVDYLARGMRIPNRGAVGDLTFYGSANLTPYLSVNRQGNMPTELSEAGYHTNPVQNTLNMNAEWKKMEAQTFFWSILKYKNIPRPKVGILTGIIKDIESGVPVNGAAVTAGAKTYTTDSYQSLFNKYSTDPEQLHNGFYYIENLPNDSVQVSISAPGFYSYTGKAFVVDSFFTFKDVNLISSVPPRVVSVSHTAADSIYPGKDKITISFSRPVDKTSFENGFSISPASKMSFTWTSDSKTVEIATDSLLFSTLFTAVIAPAVKDNYGHLFDGNKDGIGGDAYTFTFRTQIHDIFPPLVEKFLPGNNSENVDLMPVLSLLFNEPLEESTLSGKIKLQKSSDQSTLSGLMKVYSVNRKTVVNYFPAQQLLPNENYTMTLTAGTEDVYKNAMTADVKYSFKTGSTAYEVVKIDDFESGAGNWWEPQQSGSTVGIITTATSKAANNSVLNPYTRSTSSMKVSYGFDKGAATHLIRMVAAAGAQAQFNSSYALQTYLFGDGSGNKFRFCVDDGTGFGSHEVSPWYTIDWTGWKLVSWDMSKDGTGSWIGNGVLDGTLRMDSFQFTYTAGMPNQGSFYFDDLRFARKITVGVEKENTSIPERYSILQNYPNPFNPSTIISYSLPEASETVLKVYNILGREIRTLVNMNQAAGNYKVTFDASDLPSGVYVYRLTAGKYSEVKKMMLVK